MEIAKDILVTLGLLSVAGILVLAVAVFNHEREEKKKNEARREKMRKEGEMWDSAPITYLNRESLSMSGRIHAVVKGVKDATELGRDAHKRIDDNRRLMFLIENYYDERLSALEDEVRNKKKAKKC